MNILSNHAKKYPTENVNCRSLNRDVDDGMLTKLIGRKRDRRIEDVTTASLFHAVFVFSFSVFNDRLIGSPQSPSIIKESLGCGRL
jgi:hypothetical protein